MSDTENTPETESVSEPSKRKLRNPFAKSDAPKTDAKSKLKTLGSKAKTGLAVVGGVTIAVGTASYIAKKRGVESVEVTLPAVDAETDV